MREKFMPLAVAAALTIGVGACSDDVPPNTPERFTVPSSIATNSDTSALSEPFSESTFEFQSAPDTNLSAATCEKDPHSWASYIDSTPESAGGEHTIGILDPKASEGEVRFIAGATIEKLGHFTYRVATSNIEKMKTIPEIVKLGSGPVAEVLVILKPYDAVVAGRIGIDDQGESSVYWTINCLPNFGFVGNLKSVPLDELPTIPQETTQPEQDPSITV